MIYKIAIYVKDVYEQKKLKNLISYVNEIIKTGQVFGRNVCDLSYMNNNLSLQDISCVVNSIDNKNAIINVIDTDNGKILEQHINASVNFYGVFNSHNNILNICSENKNNYIPFDINYIRMKKLRKILDD